MTYEQAVNYIHSVSWLGSKPGLSRTLELCKKLGNPQNSIPFIHVTGTNGKGSSCAMLESVLRHAGYKTGLYTSPYVKFFNERMMVNGMPISDSELAELTSMVKLIAESMSETPTEFELITAIAFLFFKKHNCDIVILEAGMGGRLDSTNVIPPPLLSLITGVSLDHTAFLGDSIDKIAFEKAGIIKPGSPVLFGGVNPCTLPSCNSEASNCDHNPSADKNQKFQYSAALSVIKNKALECGSELFVTDYSKLSVSDTNLDFTTFSYKNRKDLKISLLGLYQPQNAAKVIDALDILVSQGFKISDYALRKGLFETVWHARFEKLLNKPTVIFDGSHNPESISAALTSINHYFPGEKVNILTGMMRDKDYLCAAEILAPISNAVFTVTPDNPRSLPSEELASVYRKLEVNVKSFDSVSEAVDFALDESLSQNRPLIVLGSLYLYTELSSCIEKLKNNSRFS